MKKTQLKPWLTKQKLPSERVKALKRHIGSIWTTQLKILVHKNDRTIQKLKVM